MEYLNFSYKTPFTRYPHRAAAEIQVILGDTDKMNDRITFMQIDQDKPIVNAIFKNRVAFNGTYAELCDRLKEIKVYVIPVSDFKKPLEKVSNDLFKEYTREFGTTLTLAQFNKICTEQQSYTLENYFRII